MYSATPSRRTSSSKLIDSQSPRYAHGIQRSVTGFIVVEEMTFRKPEPARTFTDLKWCLSG
jgi:hypothetical protein